MAYTQAAQVRVEAVGDHHGLFIQDRVQQPSSRLDSIETAAMRHAASRAMVESGV
jgi:hypothetical protein